MARPSGKLQRLEEMLEEIFARGESALVFTQYAEMGVLLQQRLCETFGRDMPFLMAACRARRATTWCERFRRASSRVPLSFRSKPAASVSTRLARAMSFTTTAGESRR